MFDTTYRSNLMALEELAEEAGRKRLQSHEQRCSVTFSRRTLKLEPKYHPSADPESHQSEK
jgi:hypothetical protein